MKPGTGYLVELVIALAFISPVGIAADPRALHGFFESEGKHIGFDEYRHQDQPISPAILVLHGSGGLSSHNFPYDELAHRFALRGFVVIVPHYLDATDRSSQNAETKYKKWVKVIEDALAYLGTKPYITKNRIAILGFSLGASVALAAASEGLPFAAVAECAGSLPDEYFYHLRAMPPLLILHNTFDPVVPVYNARQLQSLCQARKFSCQVVIGSGRQHGLPAPEDRSLREIESFLAMHLHT
jgi:dienelactone hydrolase